MTESTPINWDEVMYFYKYGTPNEAIDQVSVVVPKKIILTNFWYSIVSMMLVTYF